MKRCTSGISWVIRELMYFSIGPPINGTFMVTVPLNRSTDPAAVGDTSAVARPEIGAPDVVMTTSPCSTPPSVTCQVSFRSTFMSRLLEGRPTRLVHDGRVIRAHMNRERLSNTDLKILLRKNGVDDFRTIDEVILEADGSLSITRKGEEPFEFEDA